MASGVQELHFLQKDIHTFIDHLHPVLPAAPIPVKHGDTLYLSNLDDVIGTRVFTPTVYFYHSGSPDSKAKPVCGTLREALAGVLVSYYPFSGRLRETKNGKLEVYFGPKQGALMVEAHTEMSLADLGDITTPNPAWLPLIYRFPNEDPYKVIDMPLVIAQVTRFACGGFSLGLRLCHCICDGLGAMQFLSAWASMARTGPMVTNSKPIWDREIFRPRSPPIVKHPHIEYTQIDDGSSLTRSLWEVKPVQKCYRISPKFQAKIKSLARSNDKVACSTFDAMAAHVWRSWVKALDVRPLDYELRLTFSVNARPKLKNPPMKDGFYGNVVCLACVTSTVADLMNGELVDTAHLVHAARLSIDEEYLRSMVDYVEVNRPQRLEFGGKLTITQWTRFSMYESADFGWGRPVYAGPIDITPTPQVCLFLPEGGAASTGAMVLCICLPKSAVDRFKELLSLMDSIDLEEKCKEVLV
ncbi:hypothetical protein RJ641_026941 [Dillenia turbinata]|uniref:Omega-hydroxypalmitate O-feruloyl transferase n=1 Tax=Dillenia turbinata TaxID=194707 RepID=A0AAN8ZHR1_9MAGN